jgi:hypothetical protein
MADLAPVFLDSIPDTEDAFLALQAQVARTPQGGAAMMIVALLLYAEDEELGERCLAAALDRARLREGGRCPGKRDLQLIRMQVGGKPHVLRSYVKEAAPENGYRLPGPPYEVVCSANPYSGQAGTGRYKVFVASSGADSPRPVTVQQDEQGLWKAREWSSLLSGVREPA